MQAVHQGAGTVQAVQGGCGTQLGAQQGDLGVLGPASGPCVTQRLVSCNSVLSSSDALAVSNGMLCACIWDGAHHSSTATSVLTVQAQAAAATAMRS